MWYDSVTGCSFVLVITLITIVHQCKLCANVQTTLKDGILVMLRFKLLSLPVKF